MNSKLAGMRSRWLAGLSLVGAVLLIGPPAIGEIIFVDQFQALPEVGVSADAVQSLDRVGLESLPEGWTNPDAMAIVFVNVPDTDTLLVELDEAGLFFLAPFHPVTPELGGTVTLRLRFGALQSAPFNLELSPLPDAPGAFAALVASLEAHIDAFAERRGSGFGEIAALSFEDTPSGLFPLKYAQSFVQSEQNPNSLAFIADGSSDFLSGQEQRLLDQIAGHVGLETLIDLELAAIAGLDPTALNAMMGRLDPNARSCINAGPSINSAFELSTAMWEAKFGEIAVSGAPGTTLNALGATLSVGSAIPGYGKVFQALGGGTAAWQASRKALAGLNPSRFTSISAQVSRSRFEEDSEEFGSYDGVQVVAASTGWVVDQALFDAITTLIGAAASPARLGKIRTADFLGDVADNSLNSALSIFLGEQPNGAVSFCPQTWTVDISSTLYNEGRSVLGNFEVRSNQRTFRPIRLGEDFLNIAAIPSKFGQETIDIDFPLGVDPIEVTASPRTIRVRDPGEIVDITATIDNATLTTLDWDAGPGTWTDGLGSSTNAGTTRPLQTPTARADYPFTVTIESMSRRGLRSDGEPERSDSVQITLSELVVSPGSICLQPGQSRQFSATVDGSPAEVTWSLEDIDGLPSTFGTVSPTGVYTAPGQDSGRVVVVATSVEDPESRDFGIVEVGNCLCYWAVNVAGEGAWSGDEAGHTFFLSISPFTPGFRLVYFSDGYPGGLAESADASIDENVTGIFELGYFAFSSGSRAWYVFPPGEEDLGTSATLWIEENIDNSSMTGSIYGIAGELYNDGETVRIRLRNFDMSFRSAGMDGSCEDDF